MRLLGMGSKPLIPIEEAARILDTSVDNVRSFMRRGILRPQYPKGKGWRKEFLFHAEEVSALAEVREMKLTPDKVASFAVRGYVAARSLERRIEMLEQLIEARTRALPVDEESVIALYQKGMDALGYTPVEKSELVEWASIFIAMGEEFFEALEAYTDNGEAWWVLYQLARNISAATPVDQLYQDVELEAAYRYFEAARRHFYRVVYFHVRCRFGVRTANRIFEERPNDYHEEILNIIAANRPQP
jgi:hypothetical protein